MPPKPQVFKTPDGKELGVFNPNNTGALTCSPSVCSQEMINDSQKLGVSTSLKEEAAAAVSCTKSPVKQYRQLPSVDASAPSPLAVLQKSEMPAPVPTPEHKPEQEQGTCETLTALRTELRILYKKRAFVWNHYAEGLKGAPTVCGRKIKPSTTSIELEELGIVKFGRYHSYGVPVTLRVQAFHQLAVELSEINQISSKVPITAEHFAFHKRMRAHHITTTTTTSASTSTGTSTDPILHKCEDKRTAALLEPMLLLFAHPLLCTSQRQDIICTTIRGLGLPVVITEVKSDGSASHSQGIVHYYGIITSNKEVVVTNAPCLILTINHTVLSVRAVVFTDTSQPNHCIVENVLYTVDVEFDCLQELAAVLEAVKRCVMRLMLKTIAESRAALNKSVDLIYQQMFPYLRSTAVLDLRFHYIHVVDSRKRVYCAEVAADSPYQPACKDLIVKFVQGHYGTAAHQLLADAGLAPLLYEVVYLGYREWFMVVMQDVSDVSNLTISDTTIQRAFTADELEAGDDVGTLTAKHRDSERAALGLLHSHGYVHGDLRTGNMVYTAAGGCFVLDFDWAGTEGSVQYPFGLNPQVPWHADVRSGEDIRKEHDLHFFNARYAQLQIAETMGDLHL